MECVRSWGTGEGVSCAVRVVTQSQGHCPAGVHRGAGSASARLAGGPAPYCRLAADRFTHRRGVRPAGGPGVPHRGRLDLGPGDRKRARRVAGPVSDVCGAALGAAPPAAQDPGAASGAPGRAGRPRGRRRPPVRPPTGVCGGAGRRGHGRAAGGQAGRLRPGLDRRRCPGCGLLAAHGGVGRPGGAPGAAGGRDGAGAAGGMGGAGAGVCPGDSTGRGGGGGANH